MVYEVRFASDAEREFELIFDFLLDSYLAFREEPESAIDHAHERLQSIRGDIEALASAPIRGTLHDEIAPGLRHVTLGRAIVWFEIAEAEQIVKVLAIFFGGQDHVRHMLGRLLQ